MEVLYERVAGIDVGKKEIAVAIRVPGGQPGTERVQQVRKFKTFFPVLAVMVAWLHENQVTHVVMESTGVYWRPVFHALCESAPDAAPFEILLVNAAHVKNVPGRKTDVNDAQWLAQLLEVGLLQGSFIPPAEIARIRELTRYRRKLTETRTSELQRLAKVCEDAGIKIDSVASSLTTVSARHMIEALIAGERDERVLADLARGSMRKKIPDLSMALAGRFKAHHATLARMHLEHIDQLAGMIARLDTEIEAMTSPFCAQLELLRTIPGIDTRTAQIIISEIGVDMTRFPTSAHLASWAGLCPGNNESAGKHGRTRARKGNARMRTTLIEASWAAGRTHTYLGARHQRLIRRFGKKNTAKASFAIAHNLLQIIWHVLHDNTPYHDLGADYFQRPNSPAATARTHQLLRELRALGHNVQITPAA
jgi:transposase